MADNDTQVLASTESGDVERQPLKHILTILIYTSCAMATVALIYGVISWCVLKKFRNYMNFVFLNAILAYFLYALIAVLAIYVLENRLLSETLAFQQFIVINYFLFLYISQVKIHWLIVICHVFYVDIVKVFNGKIQRRYFKSGLFAWIVPFLSSIFYTCVPSGVLELNSDASDVFFYSFVLPLILNSLLYIIVVSTIFRSANANSNVTVTSKWRRLFLATLIFILSDILMFHIELMKIFKLTHVEIFLNQFIRLVLIPLLVYVYFFVVKINREAWYEFYVNELNKRQRNPDTKTDVNSVSPTTDSQTSIVTAVVA